MLLCFCLMLGVLRAENNLTATATQRYFNVVRRNLESSADLMPADKYDFRLTSGQMTFAEWLIHSAQRNFTDCATLRSETAPQSPEQLAGLKNKADVSKALKDSFAYCASALGAVDDPKVSSSPQMSYAFLHVVVHNNEIYGNVVGYLRVNGIVPPSTAARAGQKGKKN
jgi:hypothetical protein